MKLNKMQIEALASNIVSEINVEILKDNKIIKEAAAEKFLKTPVGKAVTLINASFFNSAYKYNSTMIENMAMSYYEISYIKTINKSTVENDIILNTIEATDLDTLITKIKSKYAR